MQSKEKTNRIICVSGLANSGKSTAADILYYLLNVPKFMQKYWIYKILKKSPFKKKWNLTAFAKPLKQTLSIILNKDLDWFEDKNNKEFYYVDLNTLKIYHKYKIMEDLRLTENKFSKLIKSEDPSIKQYCLSIRQLMQYYGTSIIRGWLGDKTWINATLNNTNSNLIISDLRFKTEFEEVKSRKGIVIYISRDSAKPGTHASEKEVLDLKEEHVFDYVIENNNTIEDLFNNIKQIVCLI